MDFFVCERLHTMETEAEKNWNRKRRTVIAGICLGNAEIILHRHIVHCSNTRGNVKVKLNYKNKLK